MAPEAGIDEMTFTDMVSEFETPCDFLGKWEFTPHSRARWVAWRVPCPCGFPGGPRLICDNCKDYLMLSESSVECVQCPEIYSPAREIIHHIEALK